jgi:hypothetical protein
LKLKMSTAAHARWETFLTKTHGAFDQLMWDSRVSCLRLLDLRALDPTAMSKAWLAVRAEVFGLVERISQVWRELEPVFEAAHVSSAALVEQAARGRQVGQRLLLELERMEIEVFAEAAEKLLELARATLAQELRCRRCGGSLPVPQKVFRSSQVGCARCLLHSPFEPTPAVRSLEAFCTHYLSQREAIGEWEALMTVERERRGRPGGGPELQRLVEAATRQYLQAYYWARARFIPFLETDLEREVASRMRHLEEEWCSGAASTASRP